MDSAGVRIEVFRLHVRQLAITAAGEQRGRHQRPKVTRDTIGKALRFRVGQISDFRRVRLPKRLNYLPALRSVRPSVMEGQVQGSLDDGQNTV